MSAALLEVARKALEEISDWEFGWDGDCGVTKRADEALAAIDAIAPPVAAGSVDTEELRYIMKSYFGYEVRDGDSAWGHLVSRLNAWGAQQREAGALEFKSDRKANMELFHEAQDGITKAWKERAEKAEARVKELEAGRQYMQAEGKHPAPCARDCEANAFRIEVRRLEAESAHKQAIIDRLMLEHCPDEMTAEQVKEWGEHQVRADPEQLQWPPKKDERLAGVSNKQLHILYDSLRAGKPDDTRDVEIADGVLALTRSQVDAELEARDDAPIPF